MIMINVNCMLIIVRGYARYREILVAAFWALETGEVLRSVFMLLYEVCKKRLSPQSTCDPTFNFFSFNKL